MDITLTLDERTASAAARVAGTMGKSLTELVREYLERLTMPGDLQTDLETLEQLSVPPRGDSRGWRFNREEIHGRS